MKPFLDPFPFRVPETRSSIGEVIAEITKADLAAANAQDLKELPGAAGEAAHKKLHKTIGKFLIILLLKLENIPILHHCSSM